MAMASWRIGTVVLPWPSLHQYRGCYYHHQLLPLVICMLCWLMIIIISLQALFVTEVAAGVVVVEGRVVVSNKGCSERERDALLLYKAAIEDPSGRLSSWNIINAQADDCCAWTGVVCYNTTGSSVRVAELNLQNPNDNIYHHDTETTALRGELLHPSLLSLTHLHTLNLSYNDFEGAQIPPLVGSLRKLWYLDLSGSNFGGTIPPHLGNLTNLRYLVLTSYDYYSSRAKVVHGLDWLSDLSSLIYLGMSYLDLSSASHNWISAVNMLPSLKYLTLENCKINIPLSLSFHLNNLTTSLVVLDLGRNNVVNSSFPNWLWNFTSLSYLRLDRSGIQGALPNEIGNLIGLKNLVLSSNLLSGPFPQVIMNLSSLSTLYLDNCSLIGPIPSELGNLTTLNAISLAQNSLSQSIPIEIWKLVNLIGLDLSFNSLDGILPPATLQSLTQLSVLNLGSNRLEGLIPDHLPPNLQLLDLSNNTFSGPLPPTLFMPSNIPSINVCNSNYKVIENNNISNINQIHREIIPPCCQKNSLLKYINLEKNMLSGEIPSSLGNLMGLKFLHLNNNNLKGHLPSSLQNCTQLLVAELGDNKFSGNIPLWIGQSWQYLRILRLRSNMFDGNIDPQLGYLRDLQIIDLANNKLSGPIPSSFGNLSEMISTSTQSPYLFESVQFIHGKWTLHEKITLVTKGYQCTFSSILYLVKSIDLSNNSLTDEIPEELGYLDGLYNLNLSKNYLKGKIPDSIGGMSSLETLDLSFNNLSGAFPQGLAQLNALNHLNLSYNNISGNIPSGNQLQTLDDASIYIGNPYLCGNIINKSCFHGNNTNSTREEYTMLSSMLSIYLSSALGYLVGLWSVFVLLLFKKRWRYSYFQKVDECYDKIYVAIKIRWNRIVNE